MTETSWAVVALTVVTSLFAWLGKRDSLRHDAELSAVKNQNSQQAVQIATVTMVQKKCDEDHYKTRIELKQCEEKHNSTELRLAEIEAALAKKKDDTAEHKPL